jgi:hypothetical protein
MRKWDLRQGDPMQLILAADARLSKAAMGSEAVWELKLRGGDPAALSAETSYSLLARQLKIFPAFDHCSKVLADPDDFFQRPVVETVFPNYAALTFLPFRELEVRQEFWVPAGNILAGRITCKNKGESLLQAALILSALMEPMYDGRAMTSGQMGLNWILFGRLGSLHVVVAISANALQAGWLYPGLHVPMLLNADRSQAYQWALATGSTLEEAWKRARWACASNWPAVTERIEMLNESHFLQISTGNRAWDAALHFSQNCAAQLIAPSEDPLEIRSIHRNRLPERSSLDHASDSSWPENSMGLSPLELHYFSSLLPGATEISLQILTNALKKRSQGTEAPASEGFHRGLPFPLAQPLLADMALKLVDIAPEGWLDPILPVLLDNYLHWFEPAIDADQDGWPEWPDLSMTGRSTNLLTDPRNHQGEGFNIRFLESPALAAMLFNEGQCLIELAKRKKTSDVIQVILPKLGTLVKELSAAWEEHRGRYAYRDAVTHCSPKGIFLARGRGSGRVRIDKELVPASRVIIRMKSADKKITTGQFLLHGRKARKAVEEYISHLRFTWSDGMAVATSNQVFDHLTWVEVKGRHQKAGFSIRVPDLTIDDIDLYLPLWAGIPSQEQAAAMAARIKRLHLTASGLSEYPATRKKGDEGVASTVWNQMMLLGLLRYGERRSAARIMARWLENTVLSLKRSNAFYERYSPTAPYGSGERAYLTGLFPADLFLQVIGIERIRPNEVWVTGYNPFRLPMVVQYRGMKIIRDKDLTWVAFPGGQEVSVRGSEPRRISVPEDDRKGEE